MTGITATTRTESAPEALPFERLLAEQTPVVFKGFARDWPLVRAGLESPAAAADYLKGFYSGKPVTVYTGEPEIKGRFFYNDDVSGMNFQAGRAALGDVLDNLLAHRDDGPSIYIGSTDLGLYLPGLGAANNLGLDHAMFAHHLASIWIGNRTTATAHFDITHNLAVCAAGHRRFTLFPPEQVDNLYPGPLEPTPGGQVVSMVDFSAPDFDRHPRFRAALASAQVADLEPGDVLFYPAMWWHHVEALDPFNVLVNYWWNAAPAFMDTPMNTILHALLSLRDRPEPEKQAWRNLFDYYIFGPAEHAGSHLPEAARGPLGALDDVKARRLRATLLNRLNR